MEAAPLPALMSGPTAAAAAPRRGSGGGVSVDPAVQVEGRDEGAPYVREAGDAAEEGVGRRQTGRLRFLVVVVLVRGRK